MKHSDRIDPELVGHKLDLGRPELRPILDRYAPCSALIVGRHDAATSLKDALIADGWQVRECAGPGRTRCPLLEGKPVCDLRESADVAVVYVDGKKTWPGSALLPRLRCAVDAASPAVVALEGRVDPPVMTKRNAVVGALRSPATILKTVSTVVGRDPRASPDKRA